MGLLKDHPQEWKALLYCAVSCMPAWMVTALREKFSARTAFRLPALHCRLHRRAHATLLGLAGFYIFVFLEPNGTGAGAFLTVQIFKIYWCRRYSRLCAQWYARKSLQRLAWLFGITHSWRS